MSKLDIKLFPDPILREVSSPVDKFDQSLIRLLEDMYETMQLAGGIGLAAPQVGISKQIAVIDISPDQNERIDLINPKIIKSSGKIPSEEGCLSIPEYRDTIRRHERIVVEAFNKDGEKELYEADGLLAICMQHEIDHLNGILFIDHLSRIKRELFKRWHRKNAPE